MMTSKWPCRDEWAEFALNPFVILEPDTEISACPHRHANYPISGKDRRLAIEAIQYRGFGVRVLQDRAGLVAERSILSIPEIPRVAELTVQIARMISAFLTTDVSTTFHQVIILAAPYTRKFLSSQHSRVFEFFPLLVAG